MAGALAGDGQERVEAAVHQVSRRVVPHTAAPQQQHKVSWFFSQLYLGFNDLAFRQSENMYG